MTPHAGTVWYSLLGTALLSAASPSLVGCDGRGGDGAPQELVGTIGQAHAGDACDPTQERCPPNPCDDGNPCTTDLAIDLSGRMTCIHTPVVIQDDGNPCTVDACDPAVGATHTPVAAGTSCDDGKVCNGISRCDGAGVCVPPDKDAPAGTPCPDDNVCNGFETCDGAGSCVASPPPPNGFRCGDDTSPCVSHVCEAGACVTAFASSSTSCGDDNPCTENEHCDGAGQCVGDPAAPGTTCSDGDACNGVETCQGTVCAPGAPVAVDDGDGATLDACDPATGAVAHVDCAHLDPTVSTTVDMQARCLYTGPSPLQVALDGSPLDPALFEPTRVAILRGKLTDDAGAPLANVVVAALGHPELGKTTTRADGVFDLAVLGGGTFTVNYAKPGYMTAQRQVDAQWHQHAVVEEVRLKKPSALAMPVTFGSSDAQVLKGPVVQDERGKRQSILFVPPGTTAEMIVEGMPVELPAGSVRMTEFTVGEGGPRAMPGALPDTSAYTYCAEYRIEEAEAAGAEHVRFVGDPLVNYVDNFLGFPVGAPIPSGYYELAEGVWKESELGSGVVIQIADVQNGLAVVDAGNASITISPEEAAALAELYPVGATVWRVPISHFSDPDHNLGPIPPPGAYYPKAAVETDEPLEKTCRTSGSIIECENQTLGEAIPLTGSPFKLYYSSERVPGRLSTIRVPILSEGPVHPKLVGVSLEVDVAGLHGQWSLAPVPQTAKIAWSGHDGFGNLVQGSKQALVRVGYRYLADYGDIASFGAPSDGSAVPVFGFQQPLITLYRQWRAPIGHWNSVLEGLGGWSIDAHHRYDTVNHVLYYGDGRQRRAADLKKASTIGGNGGYATWTPADENMPATQVSINPVRVAIGADGAYIAEGQRGIVRRIDAQGNLQIVAGMVPCTAGNPCNASSCAGTPTDCGNGGPATQALLGNVADVALGPGGELYIAASNPGFRIWRVANGVVTTVAGTGVALDVQQGDPPVPPDGADAKTVKVEMPKAVAVGKDGAVYFATDGVGGAGDRIFRVDTQGKIRHLAGDGAPIFGNQPAQNTSALGMTLGQVRGLAVGPDGTVFVSHENVVSAVGIDGILRRVAGSLAAPGWGGDDAAANHAKLSQPTALALGADGSLYITDTNNEVVRRVQPPLVTPYDAQNVQADNGVIETVVGEQYTSKPSWCQTQQFSDPQGIMSFCGEGKDARTAILENPTGVGLAPDGSLHVALFGIHRLVKVSPALPGMSVNDTALPSQDGRLVYLFDGYGKHLKTLDALSGVALLTFGYDPATHRLTSITDPFGRATVIGYQGSDVTLTTPHGQVTHLTLSDGYLESVTNPANESYLLAYHPLVQPNDLLGLLDLPAQPTNSGLLRTFIDPRGKAAHLEYDVYGRLVEDRDHLGHAKTLTRSKAGNVTTVAVSDRPADAMSPLGPVTTHSVEPLGNGKTKRVHTSPDGTSVEVLENADGSFSASYSDSTTRTEHLTPDPRFGLLSAYADSSITSTGGKTRTIARSRQVTLADPDDYTSLVSHHTTTTVNGATFTVHYDAASRTKTVTSPEGYVWTYVYDSSGRLVSSAPPGREPTSFTYDPAFPDRIATITIGTSAPRVVAHTYDAKGRLSSVYHPADPTRVLGFGYDLAGRLASIALPDAPSAVGLSFDANGNLASVTPPSQAPHLFAANDVDLMSSYQAPPIGGPGTTTAYAYHPNRKIKAITRPDGHVDSFGYDALGRLGSLSLDAGTISVGYDALGKLGSVTRGGVTIALGYDGTLPISETLTGAPFGGVHTVTRTFDNDFRVASEQLNALPSVAYGYDGDGVLASAGGVTLTRHPATGLSWKELLQDVEVTVEHDATGAIAHLAATADAGAVTLMSTGFALDYAGRIAQRTETIAGVTKVYQYAYHPNGQLWTVTTDGVQTAEYTYDANGNRLTGPGLSVPATYDAQDRLSAYGDATYTYGNNGELASKTVLGQVTTYTYDDQGNLLAVQSPSTTVAYTVDGLGRRIARLVDGQLDRGWIYGRGLHPLAEVDALGRVTKRFVHTGAGAPAAMLTLDPATGNVTGTYRVVPDHLGSVRLVVDAATGAVAQRMDYDEFGNVLADTNPGLTPFGFAGGLYDPDTKLVRFGARDYDPAIGRWTAKDPIRFGGGLNLYVYADGDPVNNVDRTGNAVEVCYGDMTTFGSTIGKLLPSHRWIRTSKQAVGLTGTFFDTEIMPHSDTLMDMVYPGYFCEPVSNVNEECVNQKLSEDIGEHRGLWFEQTCIGYVSEVLDACVEPAPTCWDFGL